MDEETFFSELIKYRTDNRVIEFYDQHAEDYDRCVKKVNFHLLADFCADVLQEAYMQEHSVKFPNKGDACKDEKNTHFLENVCVLDIGCGSGLVGTALHRVGFKSIHGVDPSVGLLKIAGQKDVYTNLSVGRISSTEKLVTESDSYNCVVCIGCITVNHIELSDALPEFHRLLKNGGIAVYSVSPSLNKTKALEEHLPYFEENKFELLKLERKFFRKRLGNKLKDEFSHIYTIRKS